MQELMAIAIRLVRERGLWLADEVGAIEQAYEWGLLTDGEFELARILVLVPGRFV